MGAIAITACIFSVLSFSLTVWMFIEVKAMQKSTHKFIMFDPKKQNFDNFDGVMEKSDDKKMDEIYDNII